MEWNHGMGLGGHLPYFHLFSNSHTEPLVWWPHGFAGDALCAGEGETKAAQLEALRGFTYENREFQELCDVYQRVSV